MNYVSLFLASTPGPAWLSVGCRKRPQALLAREVGRGLKTKVHLSTLSGTLRTKLTYVAVLSYH